MDNYNDATKEMISAQKAIFKNDELFVTAAKTARKCYCSLLAEGFNAEQAIQIVSNGSIIKGS